MTVGQHHVLNINLCGDLACGFGPVFGGNWCQALVARYRHDGTSGCERETVMMTGGSMIWAAI